MSDVAYRSASLTRRCIGEDACLSHRLVPASAVFCVTGDLSSLRTVQAQVLRWRTADHSFEGLGSEGPSEAFEVQDLEA